MVGPLVSIVIPSFNAEKYLADTIRSALCQTYRNCEVIVVDDGSTDGTVEVIKSFGGRIRYEAAPHRGGCAARNRGVELARGKWIQFLDADDILVEDCVASKLQTKTADGEVICCDVELFPPNGLRHSFWHLDRFDLKTILRQGSPQTAAPLHLKSTLLELGGFRDGLECAQEFELHLRMAIRKNITFVSNRRIGVRIRRRPGSLSRSAGAKMPLTLQGILLESLQTLSSQDSDITDTIYQRLIQVARGLWKGGMRSEAINLASDAIRHIHTKDWTELAYNQRTARILAKTLGFTAYETLHDFVNPVAKRFRNHLHTARNEHVITS